MYIDQRIAALQYASFMNNVVSVYFDGSKVNEWNTFKERMLLSFIMNSVTRRGYPKTLE